MIFTLECEQCEPKRIATFYGHPWGRDAAGDGTARRRAEEMRATHRHDGVRLQEHEGIEV